MDYPKAAIAYEVGDETVAVSVNGLVKAFEETVTPDQALHARAPRALYRLHMVLTLWW